MIEIWNNILGNLITFTPIIALLLLINRSERERVSDHSKKGREMGIFVFIFVGLGYGLTLLLGISIQAVGALLGQQAHAILGLSDDESLKLEWIGLGLWLPSFVALLFFIPALRRWIAKRLPIDPQNRVHTLSILLSMLVFIQMGVTLGVGLDTLSNINMPVSEAVSLSGIWSQDILLAILGLVGVGWLSRRSFREAMERLGLKKITGAEALYGIGLGIGLMVCAIFVETIAVHNGWMGDPHAQELTEKMIGSLFESIPGILTLGLAAALGEEMIFRGALLPRFGVVYTSILFALVHANYGLSIATAVVFLLALVLALVRKRFNTTVCMIVHATYNMGLGVLTSF